MSAVIVKSKRPVDGLSLAAVGELSSNFHVTVPGLSASSPMPLDFNATWEAAGEQLGEALSHTIEGSALESVANSVNRRVTFANRVGNYFNSPKRVIPFMVVASAISTGLGSLVAGWLFGFDTVSSTGIPVPATGLFLGLVSSVVPFSVVFWAGMDMIEKVFNPALKSFEAGYEKCVAQWAQKRYGVTIPSGAWAGPADRVSKDIVYLGVRDGEDVYCFKTEAGWVLGHRDGTELPVLVNGKELVEA